MLSGLVLAGLLVLPTGVNALYLNDMVNASRVPDGSIKVDGRPELIWKAVSADSRPVAMTFDDYSKIVLLRADNIRNADPALYFTAPTKGSVTMLAAFDNTALYFLFIVAENTTFNPMAGAGACSAVNLWAANAPEVFVDPSPWNPDTYSAFFSKDGSGLVYGTSPKTVQLAKPIYPMDNRIYFRDRTTPPDRFQIPSPIPNGIAAVASVHSAQDSLTFAVEMKIPFWSGKAEDFTPGKSMFISWGYNHYAQKANCDSTPIAYRWAKHYKTYGAADPKPAGWQAGDSTHFDPTRSWDGWGRFVLNSNILSTGNCNPDTTNWDVGIWSADCHLTTVDFKPSQPKGIRAAVERTPSGLTGSRPRDIRGRSATSLTWTPLFPWSRPAAIPK